MKNISFLTMFLTAYLCLPVNAHQRFVLTGGPGVGKSTVLKQLEQQGYQVVPEIYTALHNQAQKEGTLDKLFADQLCLRFNLIETQLRAESLLDPNRPAFLDRSSVDIIAFTDFFKIQIPEELRAKAHQKYDLIFFLDPLPAHLYEITEVRLETPAQSAEIHNFLKTAYREQGYTAHQLIDVPFGTPEERVQFIIDTII